MTLLFASILVYLALGVLLAYCLRMEDGTCLLLGPRDMAIAGILFWPYVVMRLIPRISRLTRNGKTLWQREGK